jgi:hypothetical protein
MVPASISVHSYGVRGSLAVCRPFADPLTRHIPAANPFKADLACRYAIWCFTRAQSAAVIAENMLDARSNPLPRQVVGYNPQQGIVQLPGNVQFD